MSPTHAHAASPGRGRDLPLLTLAVVTGDGATATFESVLCPRDGRARAVQECAPCIDALGPVADPSARGRFMACAAIVPGVPARDPEARSAADLTPVAAMMTRAVVALRADVPLAVARAALVDAGSEALPVVDAAGHAVGVVGHRDLARAAAPAADARCVADVMSRRVPSVAESAPVSEVAALMTREATSPVAVVSRAGQVVGVVTALDVVRWLAEQDDRGPRQLP